MNGIQIIIILFVVSIHYQVYAVSLPVKIGHVDTQNLITFLKFL